MQAWIGPLALCLISCGSSTTETTNTGNGTAAVAENPAFIDFAPQSSTDGQKMVFLSQRDLGAYRVFVYNEAAETKLERLSKAMTLEPGLNELTTSLSDDGSWILTWRYGTEKSYLMLNSFDQTQSTTLPLDTGSRLRELTLAPSAQRYFAYTERKAGADSVHIYSFAAGTPPTTTEEATLSGESGAQFAVSGTDVYVFTRKAGANGDVTVQYRKRSAGGSWDLQTETLALTYAEANIPSAASSLGLVYAKSLGSVRLKSKLGTFETTAEGYQKNVGVVQEANQFKAFAASPVDFSAEAYRRNQPLTLGHISATADGAYLLLTGYEAWFCKNRTQASNLMLLVRMSDGAALPFIPTRENGTTLWTGLVAEPCSYFDQQTISKAQDFDTTLSNAQILSVTGSRVTLIYESKYTLDREIRRLSFDVSDWAAKIYANPVFTDISANPR